MSCEFHVSFSRWTTTILKNNADVHRLDWSKELENKTQNIATEYQRSFIIIIGYKNYISYVLFRCFEW